MSYENGVINPILPGFNPDPNIVKVNDDYFLVVSTFEWMPGLKVYHSKDLINWAHITDILTDQVDLKGNPDNCSIWAPQLSYDSGKFYLVYTNVRSTRVPFKDCHNFLITASSIYGPWSAPVYMNSSGFDPSLFHDSDGRKWFLNELWDYRMETRNKSCGIVLQEFDEQNNRLIGEVYKIFDGTSLAKTEAPLLYLKNGFYYLITAEGGTESGHSVTVCRSRNITGPYSVDPEGVILTASDKPSSPLQCTGHGSIVEGEFGKWYMVYLCTRPLEGKFGILGRETAIQEVIWTKGGWLRLANNTTVPEIETVVVSSKAIVQKRETSFFDDFSQGIQKEWNGRRQIPNDEWCFITEDNKLRIVSGESLQSYFCQSILAIRQKDFKYEATTTVDFTPKTFNQMAGLVIYLNENNYLYCYVTWDEVLGKIVRVMRSQNGEFILEKDKISCPEGSITLKFNCDRLQGQFVVETKDEKIEIGNKQDVSFLSGGFTGTYIGIVVQDLSCFRGSFADFEYFRYDVK